MLLLGVRKGKEREGKGGGANKWHLSAGDVNVATKENHLSLSIAPIPLLFILPQTDLSDHPLANRQKGLPCVSPCPREGGDWRPLG